MFVYLIIWTLTVTVCSISIIPDSDFLSSSSKSYNQSLPSNYILSATYETSFWAYKLTYSPDENWIVYTDTNNYKNLCFMNRNIYNLRNERCIKIGDPKNSQFIWSIEFSHLGDLLFVVISDTSNNFFVFVCTFSPNMRDEDCLRYLHLGERFPCSIVLMKTNSANKMVMKFCDVATYLLSFTSDGDLKIEYSIQFSNAGATDSMWHPQAEKDTLIICGS